MEQAAHSNGLVSVSKIVLEIGQFSGVEIEALDFAFSVLKRGTILEGADIEYLTPPLVLYCKQCENEYVGDPQDPRCPACMGAEFVVVQGREMIIKSISGTTDEQ